MEAKLTREERLEIGEILGVILNCFIHVPEIPQEKFDRLTDAITAFKLKGLEKEDHA